MFGSYLRYTVQSLYKSPHYNTNYDITWSSCGSQNLLHWNITKELEEDDHEMAIFL